MTMVFVVCLEFSWCDNGVRGVSRVGVRGVFEVFLV